MVPAFAAPRRPPRRARLGVVYVPNGMMMNDWTPETDGAGFEFSRSCSRSRRSATGWWCSPVCAARERGAARGGVHAFLTGVPSRRADGLDLQAGVSMDQMSPAARAADAARVARARDRRPRLRRLVRRRLQLRVHEHHRVAQRRRRRCRWRTTRARSSSGCSATAAAPIRPPARARLSKDGSILDSVDRRGRRSAARRWARGPIAS